MDEEEEVVQEVEVEVGGLVEGGERVLWCREGFCGKGDGGFGEGGGGGGMWEQ